MPDALWLELPIGEAWVCAFRIGSKGRSRHRTTAILEVRVFPFEEGHLPGEWSARVLGDRAKRPTSRFSFAQVRPVLTERAFTAALHTATEKISREWLQAAFKDPGTTLAPAPTERQGGRRGSLTATFLARFAARYHVLEHHERQGGASTRRRLAAEYPEGASDDRRLDCDREAARLPREDEAGRAGRARHRADVAADWPRRAAPCAAAPVIRVRVCHAIATDSADDRLGPSLFVARKDKQTRFYTVIASSDPKVSRFLNRGSQVRDLPGTPPKPYKRFDLMAACRARASVLPTWRRARVVSAS